MKATLLLVSLTISAAVSAQSICGTLPDSLFAHYQTTADRLALQKIIKENSTWKDSIHIPSTESDRILHALSAVYASSSPQRDTVVKLYRIWEKPIPNMNHINLTADSNVSWIKEIRAGLPPSSSKTLDSLCLRYKARVISVFPWKSMSSPNVSVLFKTDSNYNMTALHEEFKKVENVEYVENGIFVTDGNNIQEVAYIGYTELTYSLGLGDCPSGCTDRKYWTFRIYPDCRVDFMGKFLTDLENTTLKENLLVFPNPFQEQINFSGALAQSAMKLYDSMGHLVQSKGINELEFTDLGTLPKGVYLLEVQKSNGNGRYKLLKE